MGLMSCDSMPEKGRQVVVKWKLQRVWSFQLEKYEGIHSPEKENRDQPGRQRYTTVVGAGLNHTPKN